MVIKKGHHATLFAVVVQLTQWVIFCWEEEVNASFQQKKKKKS